jgi:hypothetical protein
MSQCWECDQEIVFRYINGVCTPIHESGQCGEYRKKAIRFKCRKCSKYVFYVEHNGGRVWFDELGWPWPKHGCFEPNQPVTPVDDRRHNPGAVASRYDRQGRLRTDLVYGVPGKTEARKTEKSRPSETKEPVASTSESKNLRDAKRILCGECNRIFDAADYAVHKRKKHMARPVPQAHRTLKPVKPQADGPNQKAQKPSLQRSKVAPNGGNPNAPPANPAEVPHARPGKPLAAVSVTVIPFKPPTVRRAEGGDEAGNDAATRVTTPLLIPALDKQGRRRCEFCTARVKLANYERHLSREHGR